jgi:hypothetical protein
MLITPGSLGAVSGATFVLLFNQESRQNNHLERISRDNGGTIKSVIALLI